MKNFIAIIFFLSSWNGVLMADSGNNLQVELTDEMIEGVKNKRILFGHQSVGFNILDGIQELSTEIEIVETKIVPENRSAIFHLQVGQNTKPELKISDFKNIIKLNKENNIDIAFLKLCYIDINSDTDVDSLFNEYKNTFEIMEKEYKHIQFIHFTSPLITVQTGLKAFIKKVLGRSNLGESDNIKRQEYNELIRAEYSESGKVFDIAKIESTNINGSRMSHEKNGKVFYSMVPEYTDDGGHLNEIGRKIVAAELIKFISEIKIK